MEKIMELVKKFSPLVLASATAYFLVIALIGDIIGLIFAKIGLYFIMQLVYIVVGLFGVLKLIEMFKPELLEGLNKKKK